MSDQCIIIVPGGPPRDVCDSSSSTTTTLPFTQPAVGATVDVSVVSTGWMSSGQVLFVSGGGSYTCLVLTATTVRLTNLGYTGNAAPAAVIGAAATVSPGGLQGPAVTYQITYKPGGVAVAGQVYTTNVALNTAIASLIAAGGFVTVTLDGTANGGAVNFSESADYKNCVAFVALSYANGSAAALNVTTSAGVILRGVVAIEGGFWMCNTTTSATFQKAAASAWWYLSLTRSCVIDASDAAFAAIDGLGCNTGQFFVALDASYLGAFTAFPALNIRALIVSVFVTGLSGFLSSTAVSGTGSLRLYADAAGASLLEQTTLTGAGGTVVPFFPGTVWNANPTYPTDTPAFYNGIWYRSLAWANNKQPDQQPDFWRPTTRQRYYNAGADLWYQLSGASPYANTGTAGAEALTATSSVITNQPAPFGTAPIVILDASTGEGMATAISTKNPAAAAGTIWAWIRPGKQSQDAVIFGKFVAATGVLASIALKIKFSTGTPVVHLRRATEVTDDTLAAPNAFALAPGALVLIAATYDGATLRLYVNGILAASQALVGAFANTALSLWSAGSNGLDDLEQYEGAIDDVGMDNTVYSAATLAKMAAAGLAYLS